MAARFGDMLMNRRRQMGLSIQQVANVIKIRPQIIEFFELGDFASMPPRGYAQGMISSYARYLGLNPREVVNAYFQELYEYESSTEHSGGRFQDAAGYVSPRSASATGRFLMVDGPRPQARYGQRLPQAGYVSDATTGHEPTSLTGTRQMAPQGRRMAPAGQTRSMPRQGGLDRTRIQPRPAGMSQRGSYQGRRDAMGARQTNTGRASRDARGRSTSRSGSYSPRSGSSRNNGSNGPLIAALAVILILIVIIIFLLVRGCTSSDTQQAGSTDTTTVTQTATTTDEPETPETQDAATDPATDDAATGDAAATTPATPEQTIVTVEVESGKTSWVEIKLDGQTVYADNVTGPFSQEYTVSSTIEITASEPGNVTVSQNDETVRWDTSIAGVARVSIAAPETPATATTDENGTDAQSTDTTTDQQQ